MCHGFQHLRRSNDGFSCFAAFFYEFFLDTRKFFKIHFHAHVAAGDHDPVRKCQDLLEVFDPFRILDLGNDFDTVSAIFIEK